MNYLIHWINYIRYQLFYKKKAKQKHFTDQKLREMESRAVKMARAAKEHGITVQEAAALCNTVIMHRDGYDVPIDHVHEGIAIEKKIDSYGGIKRGENDN